MTDGYVDSADIRHREMISHYLGTRAAVSKNVKKTDWRGCGGELAANIHHCSTNYLTNPELNTFYILKNNSNIPNIIFLSLPPLAIAAVAQECPA